MFYAGSNNFSVACLREYPAASSRSSVCRVSGGHCCSAHDSSFAFLSPALSLVLPDNSRLCIPYHLSAVLNRYAVPGASIWKDIPGEEERDF